jgi:hypothetical protein
MIVVFKTALLHMHPYFMISSIERISETKKGEPAPRLQLSGDRRCGA